METGDLLWQIQEKVNEIYTREDLTPVRGRDDSYKLNNREILVWFHEVTQKNAVKYKLHLTYFNLQNDLFLCSDEIVYFTALLFLYQPYINDPIKDAVVFNGQEVFPNFQNLEAKRYSMFADIVSQKLYNFWDRVGDLIASFFPDKFKKKKIYFSTAMDAIPATFHDSENYAWLNNFKTTQYAELNKLRKQVVHHETTDTSFRHQHLTSSRNREAMTQLQNERNNLTGYYKNHIKLTLDGFEKAMLLLEEFNHAFYPPV